MNAGFISVPIVIRLHFRKLFEEQKVQRGTICPKKGLWIEWIDNIVRLSCESYPTTTRIVQIGYCLRTDFIDQVLLLRRMNRHKFSAVCFACLASLGKVGFVRDCEVTLFCW